MDPRPRPLMATHHTSRKPVVRLHEGRDKNKADTRATTKISYPDIEPEVMSIKDFFRKLDSFLTKWAKSIYTKNLKTNTTFLTIYFGLRIYQQIQSDISSFRTKSCAFSTKWTRHRCAMAFRSAQIRAARHGMATRGPLRKAIPPNHPSTRPLPNHSQTNGKDVADSRNCRACYRQPASCQPPTNNGRESSGTCRHSRPKCTQDSEPLS